MDLIIYIKLLQKSNIIGKWLAKIRLHVAFTVL